MDTIANMFPENRTLFIISDLHIGDGSLRDNLIKDDKHILLHRFLDHVEKQNGVLLILGDLFELWRYKWSAILERWWKLLDRLAAMDVIYVPGNHDELLDTRYHTYRNTHSFLEKLHRPFLKTIGEKRFKFMHGHEADPMINRYWTTLLPALRILSGSLEFGSDRCLITSDRVSDTLLEIAEQLLHGWQILTREFNHAIYAHLDFPTESWTWLRHPIRTRNMLARFYNHQQSGFYDITVTGHTHHAGHFGNWYYNCGCWTRQVVNYLTISPEGLIEVRNWTPNGPVINTVSVV